MRTVLQGVVGSTAYGLAHEGSDVDRLAIHIAPAIDVLTFGLTKSQETVVTNDPDSTSHDVGKYMALAMKGNPTVLELLWLPEYDVMEWEGDFLIRNRECLLGADAVRASYGGYAMQQIKRLMGRGDFGSDLKKRKAKHARHCFRLLLQGTHLLMTGDIKIRLSDGEVSAVRFMGDLAESGDHERLESYFTSYDNAMQSAYEQTKLPAQPNRARAKEILKAIRYSALRREQMPLTVG